MRINIRTHQQARFMKPPSIRHALSLSTLQQLLTQLSGVVVFMVLVWSFDKTTMGQFNFVAAVWLLVFSMLGFGLEHLMVQKVAAGKEDVAHLLALYRRHVALVAFVLIVLSVLIGNFIKSIPSYLFIGICCSQAMQLMAAPYRQLANGLQQYRIWLWMSITAHLLRIMILPLLFLLHQVSLLTVVLLYNIAALAEWGLSYYLCRMELLIHPARRISWKQYNALLREALPQLGVIVCQTALSRLDWILLGLLTTPILVAEYSVANKLFEMASLPLLVMAPVLFPRIAKAFGAGKENLMDEQQLQTILRIELVISVYIVLALNLCWTQLVNLLTNQVYGNTTQPLFGILSLAMPLLYVNHVYWSLLFAQEQMKIIFIIFLTALLLNGICNLIGIPLWGAKAAAASYVLAIAIQTILYYRHTKQAAAKKALFHLLPVSLAALLSGYAAVQSSANLFSRLLIGTILYLVLLLLLQQLKKSDRVLFRRIVLSN
jgi:O-antigen/teichoic acid export membrane protein